MLADANTQIDLLPMYGGVDRSSILKLKNGDEKFISDVTTQYGTREAAARRWIEQAFEFYHKNMLKMAMKRFNQAWLLNPNDAEIFHGFSVVLYAQGNNCGALKMAEQTILIGTQSLGLNEAGFLADAGLITSLCAISKETSKKNKQKYINKSDELFQKSEKLVASSYLYDKWWQALYWRGKYESAWKKIFLMRKKGGEPEPSYLAELRKKKPEPRN